MGRTDTKKYKSLQYQPFDLIHNFEIEPQAWLGRPLHWLSLTQFHKTFLASFGLDTGNLL